MSDGLSEIALESNRPRLLDLFCGAGGAAMGYHRAGFDVVGVDIKPQPNYPFGFVEANALEFLGENFGTYDSVWGPFDAIHASPPCQAHTLMQAVARNAAAHEDLIEPVRDLLKDTGLPYIIENVVGAPLHNSFTLCGSMFGLEVDTHLGRFELKRHRLFETNWPWLVPGTCRHRHRTIGLYGDHARSERQHGNQSQFNAADSLRYGRAVMEMPWADWRGIAEAIPPAYTEFIGQQLLDFLGKRDLGVSVKAPVDRGDVLLDGRDDSLGGHVAVVGEFDVEVDEDCAGHDRLLSVDPTDSPKPAPDVKERAA